GLYDVVCALEVNGWICRSHDVSFLFDVPEELAAEILVNELCRCTDCRERGRATPCYAAGKLVFRSWRSRRWIYLDSLIRSSGRPLRISSWKDEVCGIAECWLRAGSRQRACCMYW